MFKVLICGGRDFNDFDLLCNTMYELDEKYNIDVVIEGGAQGADRLGGRWAMEESKELEVYLADWDTYGKAAGHIRNQKMLEENPSLVVAFPTKNSRGTYDMINRAKKADIETIVIKQE